MMNITHPQDLMRLRRLALSSQGLLQAQPFGRGLAGARKTIKHIGYVQIDTISVVERAHNHVFHSRVPNFNPAMIHQLLLEKDIFEYWSHAAAFLPIDDYRFSLPYKHAIKSGQTHWFRNPDQKLMKELLARIRSDGPLRSRDVEASTTKGAGWWDWKPAKKALEQLYMQGDLMVSDREGFQKTYDLTERVVPSDINTQLPSTKDFAEHLVEQQLRCHGLVSLKGLTYLRKNPELRGAVKSLVNERLAQGILEQLVLDTGEVFITETGALENRLPRLSSRMMIVSPFDNAVIQRDRLKSLFQYNYQIECYVPEAKRQYGYFSLPLLYGDEFIGRMDAKVHRKTRHLEIKFLHFESRYCESKQFDEDAAVSAFVDAIVGFCHFQQCDSVALVKAYPKSLGVKVQRVLKSIEI